MNKKKQLLLWSGLLSLIFILSLFAVLPFSSKSTTAKGAEWMKCLDDDVSLTSLSIPGSHDSGALHSIGDLSGKCQDLSIDGQLKAGVRFFDIRLQQREDEMKIVHGIVDQKMDFSIVLENFKSFLTKYPSEALLVSIKKESEDKTARLPFEATLTKEIASYSSYWNLERELPKTLGELRGKIYLISRYKDNTIGLPAFDGWIEQKNSEQMNTFDIEESQLHVQDYYKVKEIEKKKEQISSCLEYSMSHIGTLTLNFTSCYYVDSFPPSYAGTTAKIINAWLPKVLEEKKNLGVLVSDYVTSDLCEMIYKRNSL